MDTVPMHFNVGYSRVCAARGACDHRRMVAHVARHEIKARSKRPGVSSSARKIYYCALLAPSKVLCCRAAHHIT